MKITIYTFLPFIGALIGALIGHRAYKNYNRKKEK